MIVGRHFDDAICLRVARASGSRAPPGSSVLGDGRRRVPPAARLLTITDPLAFQAALAAESAGTESTPMSRVPATLDHLTERATCRNSLTAALAPSCLALSYPVLSYPVLSRLPRRP